MSVCHLQLRKPENQPRLFPSQITDLVTFASLLTPLSFLPRPPLSSFPSMSLCYVSPLGPNLWLRGFEERQRWPLKMATAKFVWGQSHECTSLSVSLARLHILPPLTLLILPLSPHKLTRTRSCPCRGPIAQMTLLIMYLRYLAPVKTALG